VTVSVVICAYADERWDYLIAAITSVRAQSRQPVEIVVVVDHNDALLERVRTTRRDVVAVASDGERGLSAARNTGVAVARGDVVAFLDDDAIAERDWLARLLAPYADEHVVGVGGRIEPIWNLRGEARPQLLPPELDWVVGCTYRGMPEAPAVVRNVIGANMSFRRATILELDGFRTDVGRVGTAPAGCEETDLCIRARQLRPDAVIVYEPRARVWHRVGATRATWSYLRARCFAEGRSKAILCRRVGARDGLASERGHVRRNLSRALLAGVADAARGDAGGAARAAAVVLGVTAAATGYAVERAAAIRGGAA
jgi:glycosyltransferase involved in cell wall biosynthesis